MKLFPVEQIPKAQSSLQRFPMKNRSTAGETRRDKFHGSCYRSRSSAHINVIRGGSERRSFLIKTTVQLLSRELIIALIRPSALLFEEVGFYSRSTRPWRVIIQISMLSPRPHATAGNRMADHDRGQDCLHLPRNNRYPWIGGL